MSVVRIKNFIQLTIALAVIAVGVAAHAVDLTWTGAASNLIYDNGSATGNWNPSVPTGVQATGENWIFPDAATLGAGSTTPSFDSGGIFTVGGVGLGGLTFQTGAPTYTFTQTDVANGFNLAGSTDATDSSDRGIITNNSANKQIFNMDVISTRGTIDAKSGDIYFNSGHTFTTGGTVSLTSTSANNSIANTLTTIIQGDHNIYLNSAVVQSTNGGSTGSTGVNQNLRGAIFYRGASTTADQAGALILGDIGSFTGKIVVDSTNGGVVRATHNNSFGDGTYISAGRRDTYIGNRSGGTGATSNGVVEIDGTANNLTIFEHFRGETRLESGAPHIRNVVGNNTITAYVIPIINGGISSGADAFILESAAGTLTITGGVGTNIANNTINTYVQGNGDGAIGIGGDGALVGFSDDIATAFMNVTKRGNGTWTNLAGTPNTYRGTTTISGGKYIMNGTHSLDVNPITNPLGLTGPIGDYTVEAGGTLGGSGTIASTVNVAGVLAPGGSVGTFTIGGLNLTGGTLALELNSSDHTAGSGINDLIIDTGAIDLTGGATLNVTGIGGNLTAGDYDLIQFAGSLTGTAANITLGTIPLGVGLSASIVIDSNSVNLHVGAGLHAGDFDGNGVVDGADFVAWQTNFPMTTGATLAQGDGDGDGDVDGADFIVWQTNFPFAPSPGGSAVPEPASLTLVVLAVAAGAIGRRRRSH